MGKVTSLNSTAAAAAIAMAETPPPEPAPDWKRARKSLKDPLATCRGKSQVLILDGPLDGQFSYCSGRNVKILHFHGQIYRLKAFCSLKGSEGSKHPRFPGGLATHVEASPGLHLASRGLTPNGCARFSPRLGESIDHSLWSASCLVRNPTAGSSESCTLFQAQSAMALSLSLYQSFDLSVWFTHTHIRSHIVLAFCPFRLESFLAYAEACVLCSPVFVLAFVGALMKMISVSAAESFTDTGAASVWSCWCQVIKQAHRDYYDAGTGLTQKCRGLRTDTLQTSMLPLMILMVPFLCCCFCGRAELCPGIEPS